MGSKTALTSFCFGLWSLNNSRPLPQTSAEQLRAELITMILLIIVTTEHPDTEVSAVSGHKTRFWDIILRIVCLGKYEYEIIMRFLPQFTSKHTPMSHFQWSTVLSSDDWQPWHGFTGCQECLGDRYTYSYEKYEWGIILRAGFIQQKKSSELNWYVCGGSISWSKVFSTKQIAWASKADGRMAIAKCEVIKLFAFFIILCLTKIRSWWRWGDETSSEPPSAPGVAYATFIHARRS